MKKSKRDLILICAVLLAAGALALFFRLSRQEEPVTEAYVQVNGTEILRVSLNEDGKYIVADGAVLKIESDVTLESLGEEASASKHDVNIIEIKEGSIFCAESNCDNQICVHTPAITGGSHDTPIVCLPHELFLYVVKP